MYNIGRKIIGYNISFRYACIRLTSGYLQDSPLIGSSKFKIFCNFQILKNFHGVCLSKFLSWCPSTQNLDTFSKSDKLVKNNFFLQNLNFTKHFKF